MSDNKNKKEIKDTFADERPLGDHSVKTGKAKPTVDKSKTKVKKPGFERKERAAGVHPEMHGRDPVDSINALGDNINKQMVTGLRNTARQTRTSGGGFVDPMAPQGLDSLRQQPHSWEGQNPFANVKSAMSDRTALNQIQGDGIQRTQNGPTMSLAGPHGMGTNAQLPHMASAGLGSEGRGTDTRPGHGMLPSEGQDLQRMLATVVGQAGAQPGAVTQMNPFGPGPGAQAAPQVASAPQSAPTPSPSPAPSPTPQGNPFVSQLPSDQPSTVQSRQQAGFAHLAPSMDGPQPPNMAEAPQSWQPYSPLYGSSPQTQQPMSPFESGVNHQPYQTPSNYNGGMDWALLQHYLGRLAGLAPQFGGYAGQ